MGLTALWMMFVAAGDARRPDAVPGAAAIQVVSGSLCLWFFETIVFGVVMIVLWVIRENVRE